MANMPHVHQGRCHISFVKERGTTPLQKDIPPRLFLSGGIRNNVWRTFSTRDYAMAVCNLTGNKKLPSNVMLRYKARRRSLIICMRILFWRSLIVCHRQM